MTPIALWFSALFSDEVEGSRLSLSPGDPGNYTPDGRLLGSQCGISAREFPGAPFGSITPAYAAGIAKARYWDAHDLDSFPAGIAILLADSYYNGGKPIRWLQEAVGTGVDGEWGDESKAAFASAWAARPVLTMQVFNACRIAYDESLNRQRDMKGWAKRCDIMLCLAIQATGGLPGITLDTGAST